MRAAIAQVRCKTALWMHTHGACIPYQETRTPAGGLSRYGRRGDRASWWRLRPASGALRAGAMADRLAGAGARVRVSGLRPGDIPPGVFPLRSAAPGPRPFLPLAPLPPPVDRFRATACYTAARESRHTPIESTTYGHRPADYRSVGVGICACLRAFSRAIHAHAPPGTPRARDS